MLNHKYLTNIAYRRAVFATADPVHPAGFAEYVVDGYKTGEIETSAYIGQGDDGCEPTLMIDLGKPINLELIRLVSAVKQAETIGLAVQLLTLKADHRDDEICALTGSEDNCDIVFSSTEPYRNGINDITLGQVCARFIKLTSPSNFVLNQIEVYAHNPLLECADNSACCGIVDLAGLLSAIEMIWGGDLNLITTIEELTRRPAIAISKIHVYESTQQQIDVGFHIDSLGVNAHISTIQDRLGDYNLLLIFDLPEDRRDWHVFFANVSGSTGTAKGLNSEVVSFGKNAKIIIPLDSATEWLGTEELESGEELILEGASSAVIEYAQLSSDSKRFLFNLFEGKNHNGCTLQLEPGFNLFAEMNRVFLPDAIQIQLGDATLDDIHRAILCGGINSRFLDIFEPCWVDPEQLFLKSLIPISKENKTAEYDSDQEYVSIILQTSFADGSMDLDITLAD